MKTVVVGGQVRDIGKTSLVCAIVAELREHDWTAVKITGYGPDESAKYGDAPSLIEERERGGTGDSERYLAAGARRSFWLRVPSGHLGDAMPLFRDATDGASAAIIESNRILEFVHPDACVMLLDPGREEFKESARRFFDCASAYALWPATIAPTDARRRHCPPRSPDTRDAERAAQVRPLQGKPVFDLTRGCAAPAGLIDFVRKRLKEGR